VRTVSHIAQARTFPAGARGVTFVAADIEDEVRSRQAERNIGCGTTHAVLTKLKEADSVIIANKASQPIEKVILAAIVDEGEHKGSRRAFEDTPDCPFGR
jgi:hypothetical protein